MARPRRTDAHTDSAAEHCDVLIIGAGSAGCALATRLTENSDRSVVLLEAGIHYGGIDGFPWALRRANVSSASLPGSGDSWPFMATITDGIAYPVTRGKVVGGSSAVNGTLYMRAHPEDFDGFAKAGNEEWSFDKVLPSFIRSETDLDLGAGEYHGASGPMPVVRPSRADLSPISEAFLEASSSLGHSWDPDMNGPSSTGVGLLPTNSVNGIRQNAAVRYLEPVLARPNLTLHDRTSVQRIIFRGNRAVGVDTMREGTARRYTADEIVLCAGAIKSPQLLMVSGVGRAALLHRLGIEVVHDSPFVGQGIMDHPGVRLSYETDERHLVSGARPIAEVGLNFPTDGIAQGPIRIIPFLFSFQQMLFGTLRGNSMRERLGGASFLAHPLDAWRGVWGTSLQSIKKDFKYRNARTINCSLALEESRGELSIVSADPSVAPSIDYRFLTEAIDLRRLREGIRLTVELFEHASFQRAVKPVRLSPGADVLADDAALDAWIRKSVGTAYHSTSTLRMGPDTDESAVVDQYGRVRGVEGLRVLDLSILPNIVGRPTAATAIMIGERGAEFFDAR